MQMLFVTLALSHVAYAAPKRLTKTDLDAANKLSFLKKTYKQFVADVTKKLGAPIEGTSDSTYWVGCDGEKAFTFTIYKESKGDSVGNTGVQESPFEQARCKK